MNQSTLARQLGVPAAVVMGMGSIVGTGVFVSVGIGVGLIGPAVIVAIAVAALVATCNGLSSAQLAASHPVAGGTYAYGYRYLHPAAGFTAGWLFLIAKSASAATAALGFAGYLMHATGIGGNAIIYASVAVVLLTALVLVGLRRTHIVNTLIVGITLAVLVLFIFAGLPSAVTHGSEHLVPFFGGDGSDHRPAFARLLEACALMFVAYTGYGRIATMGEEIRDPQRSIPRAILITLGLSMLLYVGVGAVGVAAAGPAAFDLPPGSPAAPLEVVAQRFGLAGMPLIISLGAITAMLGVLLNLILGLSRVMLAMGRQGDMPAITARVDRAGSTPWVAVLAVSAIILVLVLIGDVKATWSFSAFTVLMYYALTNLAALRLPREHRLYPRSLAWIGLFACAFLAFWVEPRIWMIGLGLIAAGLLWHKIAQSLRPTRV